MWSLTEESYIARPFCKTFSSTYIKQGVAIWPQHRKRSTIKIIRFYVSWQRSAIDVQTPTVWQNWLLFWSCIANLSWIFTLCLYLGLVIPPLNRNFKIAFRGMQILFSNSFSLVNFPLFKYITGDVYVDTYIYIWLNQKLLGFLYVLFFYCGKCKSLGNNNNYNKSWKLGGSNTQLYSPPVSKDGMTQFSQEIWGCCSPTLNGSAINRQEKYRTKCSNGFIYLKIWRQLESKME